MLPDEIFEEGSVIAEEPPELIFDDGDKLADDAPPPEYIINDVLETDAHGICSGSSMAFKTFLALRLAFSVCTGRDFFGHTVFTTGKVLYICGEGTGAISRRIKAIKITEGEFNSNFCLLRSTLRIDNTEDMRRLGVMIEKLEPALVIFDTFASLISVSKESDPSDAGRTLRLIKETCRNGKTSSLIIHHFGKDESKGSRGASNFINDPDFSFKLSRVPETMLTEFSCEKMKDGENFRPLLIRAHIVELGLIRQDGSMATSLVLKPTDETPKAKKIKIGKSKREKNEVQILDALSKVIETDGVEPSDDIKREYTDFNNSHQKNRKVAQFSQLKTAVLEKMVTDSDNKHSREMAFNRAFKNLTIQCLVFYCDDFVWQVFSG